MLEPEIAPGRGWSRFGSLFGPLNWHEVQAEVERECRGRVALVGLPGVGKSTLFNRLRGWEISPVSDGTGGPGHEDLGVFRLVDLSEDGPTGDGWPGFGYEDVWWVGQAETTLVVFVLDVSAGVRPAEYGWLSRMRAAGRPLVTVLNKVDVVGDRLAEAQWEVERRLATRVIPISAEHGDGVADGLVWHMLRACPEVAVPLGRELEWARRLAARALIRQAALWSTLAGVQPVPLLDVPFQMAGQQRLVIRIAAMYGQPLDGGREVLATLAGGLGVRLVAQQVAKLVPILGWGASAALSGLSTWLLGWGAVAYYEGQVAALGSRLKIEGGRMKGAVAHYQGQVAAVDRVVWDRARAAGGRLRTLARRVTQPMTRLHK